MEKRFLKALPTLSIFIQVHEKKSSSSTIIQEQSENYVENTSMLFWKQVTCREKKSTKKTLLCQRTHSLLPVGNEPCQRGHLWLVGPGSGCAYSAAIAAEGKLGTLLPSPLNLLSCTSKRSREQLALPSALLMSELRS